MLLQRPPQRGVPRGDGGVVAGPDIQLVIIFQQQRPFAGVELWCCALRLDNKLAGVIALLLFLVFRHHGLLHVRENISTCTPLLIEFVSPMADFRFGSNIGCDRAWHPPFNGVRCTKSSKNGVINI